MMTIRGNTKYHYQRFTDKARVSLISAAFGAVKKNDGLHVTYNRKKRKIFNELTGKALEHLANEIAEVQFDVSDSRSFLVGFIFQIQSSSIDVFDECRMQRLRFSIKHCRTVSMHQRKIACINNNQCIVYIRKQLESQTTF